MRRPHLVFLFCLTAALGLAGCDSAAEKAQKHYLAGLELAEAGDIPRALIELRNAFTFDPDHPGARLAYARLNRENGNLGEAYAQYQRVVETAPDTLEARQALAEISILISDWPEAERHVQALQRLDPKGPDTALFAAALDYRRAVVARDPAAAATAAKVARATLARDPANLIAHQMLISEAVAADDPARLKTEVEAALAALPTERSFHIMRLRLLAEAGDKAGLGPAIEAFVAAFPADEQARQMLITWYVDTGDLAGAETYLRRLAEAPEADLAARMTLVEFLLQAKGPDVGRTELDRLIAEDPAPLPYLARRAALDFDLGKTAEGLAAMTALIAETPADAPQLSDLKVTLARMLAATGDVAGSVARLDEVLAQNPAHVAALKLKANWLIDNDRPTEAITTLRTALAEAPRDAEILMLMGDAQDRDGARPLAGDSYARAVEASGRAPAESLFYARFLMQDGRMDTAADVLGDALRLAPRDVDLLTALAEIRLGQKDFDSASAIAATLKGLGQDRALEAARVIETESLMLQDRVDETIAYLQDLARNDTGNIAATARMVQLQVEAGKLDAARAFLDARLAETPDAPALRFLRAGLHVLENTPDKAEAIYRDLLAADPAAEPPLRALYSLLQETARASEAAALLDDIRKSAPDAPLPLLLQAGAAEAAGDIERAIALYETLYATDSGNLVVANNLASLLAAHRDDAASLDRASTIARRLAGSKVPAFQDTYGWLQTRTGNPAGGLADLQAAAGALPNDAMVQLHLGLTYLALEQPDAARPQLQKALALAGDSPLPAFAAGRTALAGLGAP
jgi:cellulose synthase operon protein C